MIRVFLDRWAWIHLCRASLGRPAPNGTVEAFQVIRFASEHSLVSFPLCPATYIEQLRNSNVRQRKEMGEFMLEISRQHTMAAPVEALAQREVDLALQRRFGLPHIPTEFQVFGVGISHAVGLDVLSQLKLLIPPEITNDPDASAVVLNFLANDFEKFAISGPGQNEVDESSWSDDEVAEKFVAEEKDLASRFQGVGAEFQRRTLVAREFIRLQPLLQDAHARSGVPWQRMFEAGREYLTEFVYDLPVVSSQIEMLRQQHRMPQRGWRRSDQYDLVAFSMAVVHCDIIVIEKHWADLMRRSELDKRFGTLILSGLGELPVHLI